MHMSRIHYAIMLLPNRKRLLWVLMACHNEPSHHPTEPNLLLFGRGSFGFLLAFLWFILLASFGFERGYYVGTIEIILWLPRVFAAKRKVETIANKYKVLTDERKRRRRMKKGMKAERNAGRRECRKKGMKEEGNEGRRE